MNKNTINNIYNIVLKFEVKKKKNLRPRLASKLN